MNLGDRLKALRIKHSMSQLAVAQRIGKTRADISDYEARNTIPHIDTIAKIADLFHVSVDYLLGRTDDPYQLFPAVHQTEHSQTLERIADLLREDLSKRDLEEILQFLKLLQERNEKNRPNE